MDISDFALAKLRADNLGIQQQVSLLVVQTERLRATLEHELLTLTRVVAEIARRNAANRDAAG